MTYADTLNTNVDGSNCITLMRLDDYRKIRPCDRYQPLVSTSTPLTCP